MSKFLASAFLCVWVISGLCNFHVVAQVKTSFFTKDYVEKKQSSSQISNQINNWLSDGITAKSIVSRINAEAQKKPSIVERYEYLLSAASCLSFVESDLSTSMAVLDLAALNVPDDACKRHWLSMTKANVLGVIKFNHYEEAKALFSKVHNEAMEQHCFQEAVNALMSWANALEAPRLHYTHELKLKLRALKIAKDHQLRSATVASIISSIAVTHFVNKNYEQAGIFWKQELELNKQQNDFTSNQEYIILNNLGLVHYHEGKYAKSKRRFNKALDVANKMKDSAWIALLSGNMAKVYLAESNLDSAYILAEKNHDLGKKTNLLTSAMNAKIMQAEILMKQDQWSMAETKLMEVQNNYLPNVKDFDRLESSLRAKSHLAELLSKVEARKGNFKAAYSYNIDHMFWADSLSKMETQSQVSQMQAQFNFDQQESEKAFLKAMNDVGQSKIQYQNRIIFTITLASLFFLFIILLLIWYYRRQRTFNQQLEESNNIIVQYLDELKLANVKLEEANKLKEKLITIIGHDLRQPLIGLHNLISLIENHRENAMVINKSLPMASYKLSETMNLMDNLIVWSKQHAGGWSPKYEVLWLRDVVVEATSLAAPIAQQKKIALFNKIPEHIQVDTDRNVLLIVLRNLVSNALKFTLSGGHISISCQVENKDLYLDIEDTGTGMDNEIVHQLFKQSGMSIPGTMKERGHGLGLMLCKDFVEKLGGSISVESELGKGSCFRILIPGAVLIPAVPSIKAIEKSDGQWPGN